MSRAPLILGLVIASVGPASALEEPYIWRDQESGCAYILTQAGGITPRLRRDGAPDCPDAREPGTALVDNAVRGLRRGLDDLRRELDNRLGNQTNPPPR
jgi:hypothetical protein